MSNETPTEVVANPYNAKKAWHPTEEKPRGLVSADDAMYQEPKKEPEKAETTEKPYRKVDYKKRYDDLKRHHDKKIEDFKAKEQEWATNSAPKYVVPKTPEDLAKFKEQYPEVYGTIETIAHEMSQKNIEQLQNKLKKFEERENKLKKQEAESELVSYHPDFKELRSSPVFHKWVQEQPKEIQSWLYNSLDAKLAAKAISMFKKEIKWNPKDPSNKKPADPSARVKTRGATSKEPDTREKIWTTSEIKKLSVVEYDRFSKDIDKAFSEGRVIKG